MLSDVAGWSGRRPRLTSRDGFQPEPPLCRCFPPWNRHDMAARHRVFGDMVSILAPDYAVVAYACHWSTEGAQSWARDRGVRI